MTPIQTPGEVFVAVQNAKAEATAFCTNFFPVESKLQGWIDHGGLLAELHNRAAFFFRKDRDFQRFYFCAADATALGQGMAAVPGLKTEPVMTDLVGNEAALKKLLPVLESAGFRRYTLLQRMARIGRPEAMAESSQIEIAGKADCPAVLELIENSFDRHGEQIPMLYEIESAVENRQILAAWRDGELAGLLYFETQGFASAVRFWAVAKKFHGRKIGSALMQHYFKTQESVRRFTLWVNSENQNAIEKYRHYGYAPDGLMDQVLAGQNIHP